MCKTNAKVLIFTIIIVRKLYYMTSRLKYLNVLNLSNCRDIYLRGANNV